MDIFLRCILATVCREHSWKSCTISRKGVSKICLRASTIIYININIPDWLCLYIPGRPSLGHFQAVFSPCASLHCSWEASPLFTHQMEVSQNGGNPWIIHSNGIFHYKPTNFWGTPHGNLQMMCMEKSSSSNASNGREWCPHPQRGTPWWAAPGRSREA